MVFGCVGFCRIWYTRVYQNMTSNGGLAPRRLHGWLWPVEVARWLGSTLGDMNHKPMASPSMVCTFYLPCITPQNVQFGTPGCTGSRQLDRVGVRDRVDVLLDRTDGPWTRPGSGYKLGPSAASVYAPARTPFARARACAHTRTRITEYPIAQAANLETKFILLDFSPKTKSYSVVVDDQCFRSGLIRTSQAESEWMGDVIATNFTEVTDIFLRCIDNGGGARDISLVPDRDQNYQVLRSAKLFNRRAEQGENKAREKTFLSFTVPPCATWKLLSEITQHSLPGCNILLGSQALEVCLWHVAAGGADGMRVRGSHGHAPGHGVIPSRERARGNARTEPNWVELRNH